MTIVLVHGAGDSARRWGKVRARLVHDVVAVDLLGRGSRPFDLTAVTVDAAAEVAAADVAAAGSGPYVVVAHSAGGIVAPQLCARLGDVQGLVMVAGLCAPEGQRTIDTVFPDSTVSPGSTVSPETTVSPRRGAVSDGRGAELLARYRGYTFVEAGDPEPPNGLEPLRDRRVVQSIDSLVLMDQTVSWGGVDPGTERVWVRCLSDRIQPPDMQERLIAASGAAVVHDLDTGHSPAEEDPEALASLINKVAGAQLRAG